MITDIKTESPPLTLGGAWDCSKASAASIHPEDYSYCYCKYYYICYCKYYYICYCKYYYIWYCIRTDTAETSNESITPTPGCLGACPGGSRRTVRGLEVLVQSSRRFTT
ncbi:unnamed protein product [Pleuronectes platessa]|uniref:Uncharacterized protein n=1 Tax=Pleuronectes platessa TaxID=8262 RepID=A0A9N7THU7_PLEPL|nr:unnamed protein product [Pleuronectes platessa]